MALSINITTNETRTLSATRVAGSNFVPSVPIFKATLAGSSSNLKEGLLVWDWGENRTSSNVSSNAQFPMLNNMRESIGHIASPLYTTAGTKTITMKFYEWGKPVLTETFTFDVLATPSDEAFFQTIFVDPTGNYTDFPAVTPDHSYTSLSDVFPASLGSNPDRGEKTIVYIKPGETYGTAGTTLNLRAQRRLKILPAPDAAGAKPIVKYNLYDDGNDESDFYIFQGIRFEQDWDTTTETGTKDDAVEVNDVTPFNNGPTTFYDCEFDGISTGVVNTPGDTDFFIADCMFTNWQNFAIYGGQNVAIIGCSIEQDVDALLGHDGKDGTSNEHGPFRHGFKDDSYVVIQHNRMFSNTGWTTNVFFSQPCVRLFTGSPEDCRVSYCLNLQEGGGRLLEMTESNPAGGAPTGPTDTLIAHNMIAGTAQTTSTLIQSDNTGIYIQNNLFFIPDTPLENSNFSTLVSFGTSTGDGLPSAVTNVENYFRGNTLVNLRQTGSDITIIDTPNANGTVWNENDNLIHEPNLTSPNTGGTLTPVDVELLQYKGLRWSGAPTLDTSTRSDDKQMQYVEAASGHTGYRAASSSVPVADFHTNIRQSGNRSVGAFDADAVAR